MNPQQRPPARSDQFLIRAGIGLLGLSAGFLLLAAVFGEASTIGQGAIAFGVVNGLFGVAFLRSRLFLRHRNSPNSHGQ